MAPLCRDRAISGQNQSVESDRNLFDRIREWVGPGWDSWSRRVDGIGDEDVKDADTRVSGFVKLGSNHSSIEVIATAFSHLDVDTLRIMLGAILEHRVMDGDRFGAKDVIRRSNGFWDLEVPSSTLHDELIGCIVASWQ